MTRQARSITLSLEPHQKQRLEQLAVAFDCLWGDRANVSELVKAIADGRLILQKPNSPIRKADQYHYRHQLSEIRAALDNLESLVD